MSCNCNGICTQACAKGAVEPEDIVIEFENKSGEKFRIEYEGIFWSIFRLECGYWEDVCKFKLLKQAKKCAEALKESV